MSQDDYGRCDQKHPPHIWTRHAVLSACGFLSLSVVVYRRIDMQQTVEHVTDLMRTNGNHMNLDISRGVLDLKVSSGNPITMSAERDEFHNQVLRICNQIKAVANTLFEQGNFEEALQKYGRCKANLQYHQSKEFRALLKRCLLNAALCNLKLQHYDAVITNCSEVLNAEANNVKALFWRGIAFEGKGLLTLAAADLKRVTNLSPCNEDARAAYANIKCKLSVRNVSKVQTEPVNTADTAAPIKVRAAPPCNDNLNVTKATIEATSSSMILKTGTVMKGMPSQQLVQLQNDFYEARELKGRMTPETAKTLIKEIETENSSADTIVGASERMKKLGVQKLLDNLMANLTVDDLKIMYQQLGVDISNERAPIHVEMFKNFKPEQVDKLMVLADYLQQMQGCYEHVRGLFFRNVIIGSILFLLMIMAARRFGFFQ